MKKLRLLTALGVLSLAVQLTVPAFAACTVANGSAATGSAPAQTFFNGQVYAAWKDYGLTEYTSAPYTSGPCPDWTATYQIDPTESAQPPALAVAAEVVYLAWTNSSGQIEYSKLNGSTLESPSILCFSASNCPQVASGPALFGNSLNLYAAWTTASDQIMLASYSGTGYWTPVGAIPSASTTLAPALAVGGAIYVAWVPKGKTSINYATLPLTGGSWTLSQVGGTNWSPQTNVAPALGVSSVPGSTGLWAAWAASATDATGFEINYSHFTLNSTQTAWEWTQPAVVSNSNSLNPSEAALDVTPSLLGYIVTVPSGAYTTYVFAVAYVTGFNQIPWQVLQTDTVSITHPCPCPTCCI